MAKILNLNCSQNKNRLMWHDKGISWPYSSNHIAVCKWIKPIPFTLSTYTTYTFLMLGGKGDWTQGDQLEWCFSHPGPMTRNDQGGGFQKRGLIPLSLPETHWDCDPSRFLSWSFLLCLQIFQNFENSGKFCSVFVFMWSLFYVAKFSHYR